LNAQSVGASPHPPPQTRAPLLLLRSNHLKVYEDLAARHTRHCSKDPCRRSRSGSNTNTKPSPGSPQHHAHQPKTADHHGSSAPSVVWTSLGPLPRWVPGPTTRWAPGATRLALHGTCWRGAQGLQRRSTRLGSCTCPALYRGLLDVLDLYSLPEPTCNPASRTI
jgi:hypothetical protein